MGFGDAYPGRRRRRRDENAENEGRNEVSQVTDAMF